MASLGGLSRVVPASTEPSEVHQLSVHPRLLRRDDATSAATGARTISAPMTAVIPNTLRLRDDVVNADPLTGGDRRDDILANAPAREHGFFGVPKVIE